MVTLLGLAGAVLLVVSLPYWLPPAVVALRVRIFAWVNGEQGIPIPGKLVHAERLKQVYGHPAANGRSRGAVLSDLFWYWLSPGPHIHQEHLEPGERYNEVARTTRRVLHVPRVVAEELTADCTARVLNELDVRRARIVRLRDLMMPVWAEFYYRLVFAQPCPPAARRLIVDNADDVATSLKCCGLRHMDRRNRLTEFLVGKVTAGEVAHPLPERLSVSECAWYLQGTFFNTAVVQMSEAMAHLLMAIAQHDSVRERLVADPTDDRYLGQVIDETLRLYPLFGIAHRITSADITVDEHTIPAGAVLCFNYPEYHRRGFAHPERFEPDRWRQLSARDANFIPFGVATNRPCPAWHIAPLTMAAASREVLARFDLRTSARHTRSMPNRAPCLLVSRGLGCGRWRRTASLAFLRLRDRVEDVWRSVVQLVLGSYMVWDARRQQLCTSHFESLSPEAPRHAGSSP